MRSALWFLALTLLVGCASNDHRLEGRWKSNKQLSVDSVQFGKPVPAPLRKKFDDLFGKLVVTYDRTHVTAEMPPTRGFPVWRQRSRYRVTASNDNSLTYVFTNPDTNKRESGHVHFDGPNRYWIDLHHTGAQMRGKEFFDRISSP